MWLSPDYMFYTVSRNIPRDDVTDDVIIEYLMMPMMSLDGGGRGRLIY